MGNWRRTKITKTSNGKFLEAQYLTYCKEDNTDAIIGFLLNQELDKYEVVTTDDYQTYNETHLIGGHTRIVFHDAEGIFEAQASDELANIYNLSGNFIAGARFVLPITSGVLQYKANWGETLNYVYKVDGSKSTCYLLENM